MPTAAAVLILNPLPRYSFRYNTHPLNYRGILDFIEEPLHRGEQNTRGWKLLRFSTEIAVYLGNVRDRPMVAMEA